MKLDPSEMKNPLDELAVSGLGYLPTRVEPLRNRFTRLSRNICITIQAFQSTIINLAPLSRASGTIGPINSYNWLHSVQPDTLGCVFRCGWWYRLTASRNAVMPELSIRNLNSPEALPPTTSKHITKVDWFFARISRMKYMQAALKTGAEGKTDLVDTMGAWPAIKDDERFLIMNLYIDRQGMKPGKRLLDRVSLRSK